jgi:hypothetical protein
MKFWPIVAILAAVTTPTLAADIGLSLNIGRIGPYGHINTDRFPRPQLINRYPVSVSTITYGRAPIYLHVPTNHSNNWRRYCHRYNACNERVYFVRSNWYSREYRALNLRRSHERRANRRGYGLNQR